jgi:hypothetical protein
MENVGMFNDHLELFMPISYTMYMDIWNSLWSFGIFSRFWYVCVKKNLATLFSTGPRSCRSLPSPKKGGKKRAFRAIDVNNNS